MFFCLNWCFNMACLASGYHLCHFWGPMGWTDHCIDPEFVLYGAFPLWLCILSCCWQHWTTLNHYRCHCRASLVKRCFVWGLQHLVWQGCYLKGNSLFIWVILCWKTCIEQLNSASSLNFSQQFCFYQVPSSQQDDHGLSHAVASYNWVVLILGASCFP